MTSNAILEVKNVWKKIDHHVLIKNLSLTMYEKDIVGFIGPNGAGKTTSIKLILGLQSTNGGTIKIDGYDTKTHFEKAIKNVGAIIENPDLYMYMSGYDNLKINAKIYNVDKKRIDEVIKLVGLEDRIHDKVKKYSLGMRQRLGIAQAILHKPKLLILDEPLNGLDPEGINELKELLKQLSQKENMSILISSHILSELETLCNRICILSKGVIIKDEETANIKKVTDLITYTIEVNNITLDGVLYQYEKIDTKHIKVKTTKEKLNNIIKTLLLNNIAIYEIKKDEISLEKTFLNLTKEKKDA